MANKGGVYGTHGFSESVAAAPVDHAAKLRALAKNELMDRYPLAVDVLNAAALAHSDLVARERYWRETAAHRGRSYDAAQAKIDALMLEYCPEEMTPEQLTEWGKNQVRGSSPTLARLVKDVRASMRPTQIDAIGDSKGKISFPVPVLGPTQVIGDSLNGLWPFPITIQGRPLTPEMIAAGITGLVIE